MSDDPFPLTTAQLTGNFCETLCYGIYLATCGFCFRNLLFTDGAEERLRRPSEIRWLMLSVALIFLAVCTFDVVIGLIHNIEAFVTYKGPGGAVEELTNIHDWINLSRSLATIFNMLLGDFVLVYRCYIVYARRWIVILPSTALYLGGIAVAIRVMHIQITAANGHITLTSSLIKPWATSFFAITAVQNVLTTSLLIWRIWLVEHQGDAFRIGRPKRASYSSTNQPGLRRVIRIIAESGAAYTTMVSITFVIAMCNSNALYPLSDVTLQAAGITFNVIIARSSTRREEQFTNFQANDRGLEGKSSRFGSLPLFVHPDKSTRRDTIDSTHTIHTVNPPDAEKIEDIEQGASYKVEDIKVDVSVAAAGQ